MDSTSTSTTPVNTNPTTINSWWVTDVQQELEEKLEALREKHPELVEIVELLRKEHFLLSLQRFVKTIPVYPPYTPYTPYTPWNPITIW